MTDTAAPPTLNVKLLQRVLAHIEADPAQWDQDAWAERNPACDTRHCFAGWTVALALPEAEFLWKPKAAAYRSSEGADSVRLPDGAVRSIAGLAIDLLGLDAAQLSDLFYSFEADTLDGLRRVVGRIVATSAP